MCVWSGLAWSRLADGASPDKALICERRVSATAEVVVGGGGFARESTSITRGEAGIRGMKQTNLKDSDRIWTLYRSRTASPLPIRRLSINLKNPNHGKDAVTLVSFMIAAIFD